MLRFVFSIVFMGLAALAYAQTVPFTLNTHQAYKPGDFLRAPLPDYNGALGNKQDFPIPIGALPSPFRNGTISGNTSKFVTTTGTLTSGHCIQLDANGNIVDAGAACFVLNSAAMDAAFGSAVGGILFRNATAWQQLNPGGTGFPLVSQGSSIPPVYTPLGYGGIQSVTAGRLLGNPFGSPGSMSEIPLGSSLKFLGGALVVTAGSGDVSWNDNTTNATTLATVNGNVGSFGNGSNIPNFTVNGKGLVTAAGSTQLSASNMTTGTLPIGQGGSGDTGSGWSGFSAAPACGSATFGAVTTRFKTMAPYKTTVFQADIQISALGTCATVLSITLPNTANSNTVVAARDVSGTGGNGACEITSTVAVCVMNGAMSAATELMFGGSYENQ